MDGAADPPTITPRSWCPILESPLLRPILVDWQAIDLPDCWLVAGAVAQTIWNDAFGLPPANGIADIDIVYFDPGDVSEAAEAAHAGRLRRLFSRLPTRIDVKNEARVHLWHAERFGYRIAPYTSSAQALTTFPTTATAVGLRPGNDTALEVEAPFGTSDLMNLVVRPNKTQITEALYEAKVARWLSVWPRLTIIPWQQAASAVSCNG